MMKALSTVNAARTPVRGNISKQRGEGAGIGSLTGEAASDLTRLALAGAGRVELAACATGWVERMFPGWHAVVVEAVEGTDVAVVLADITASGAHMGGRFALGEGSVITQALGQPSRVIRATGAALVRSLPGLTSDRAQDSTLVCAGIMGKNGACAVLAALADCKMLANPVVMDVAFQVLASQLAVARAAAGSRAAAAGAYEAIARAKLEWEGTADALADLVCLLDANGRIVRANRVVEQWRLGQVGQAIGRLPHEVFHPNCSVERCSLTTAINKAWQELRKDGPSQFEYWESAMNTLFHFSFRPMLPGAMVVLATGETLAVLVVSDVSELHRARESLNRLNLDLELKVRGRTQELREANRGLRNEVVRRKAAEAALRASHGELAILSQQLILAQENERLRISRELHDSVGQSLAAIKYSLERAAEMLRRPGLGDPWPVLTQAIRGTQETADSIRTIATNLRPTTLDDMGAASAVGGFCQQFADVYQSIVVEAVVSAADVEIPDRLATAVFRSAQELLNNVAKHAEAKVVRVELRREALLLILEVRDDGIGIAASGYPASTLHGHGIRNLRERAEMTGGSFLLRPRPEGGTVARISWQLLQDEITGQEAE
jgi:signal transduction histidine kinase